jgi:hypothetical protein
MPGNSPASSAPRTTRQAKRPPYDCTSPFKVAVTPQKKVMKAIQRLGVNFFNTRFDGTSNVMYVTKRMDTAT